MKGNSETAIFCLGERERCANKQKGKVTNLKVSAIFELNLRKDPD